MKKLLSIFSILCIIVLTSSCVDDAYEEIELTEIKVEKSETDEDDIPPNPPGGCSCTEQTK
ncbi:MAG: hypothetical protein WBA74_08895 [Cyclobacteriaceae bacterium]